MNVGVTVSDDDRVRLSTLFGSTGDIDRLIGALAQAGTAELLAQATGRAVFSSMADLRLYRIYCLLAAGLTLKEAETAVHTLFKVPPGSARRLIENAIARYDVALHDGVYGRIAELLDSAVWKEERWEVELPAGFARDSVLEEAGRIELADPERAGRGTIWRFPNETYQAVRGVFGLKSRPKPKT